ncbi:MAG: ABC transporter permease [Cytophagia bacterium]|nr:ABC transporter permease [Cytophagia bacterium]
MSKPFKNSPPKWADRFLMFFCNPRLLEQLQGDVYELFYWRLEEKGYKKAKRSFVWDVIRLFRWSNIKRKSKPQKTNNMGIIKNYFKVGLRNLWKQRLPSTINVLGLSIALACSIVAFKFIEESYNKDFMHVHKDDTFLVTHWEELESNTGRNGKTDNQLTREIIESVPGIEKTTRYHYYNAGTKVNGRETTTFSLFVDEDYLDIFTFQLVAGNINALSQPDQIVISEDAAQRFFGQSLGLDEEIELKIGNEWKVFTVGAVLKSRTRSSSLQNYLLVNYIHMDQALKRTRETWDVNFFIQRQKGVDEQQLVTAMNELLPLHNKDNDVNPYTYFELEPLPTMARHSNEMMGGIGTAPQKAPNLLLIAIAGFMFILATFNYINISLAMVMKRFKEIGIRKVVGGQRRQLISQFLIENFLLCAFSLFLGVLLSGSILLPAFNEISGASLKLDILQHQNFWLFLLLVLGFITLVSGIYPALVASAYRPTNILNRTASTKTNKGLSAFFLSFQMVLALITIVAAVMFVHTNRVNEARDWGYDQYNKLMVNIPDSVFQEPFRDFLEADPNVLKVAGTKSYVGRELNGVQFKNGEKATYAELFNVGVNYPQLLGLRLKEGRFFDENLDSDLENALVVNESFLDALSLTFDPDGTFIDQDSLSYRVVGVVEDYFYWAPDMKIRGAAMRAVPSSEYGFYLVEMREGNILAQRDIIQKQLRDMADEEMFGVSIQSQIFDGHFEDAKGIRNVMLFTAIIAIIIASMGLYGLVNINISNHIKSYGIRKVLGASGFELGTSILKKYRYVFLFAILIGCSVSVLLIGGLLGNIYAYYPKIGFGPLAISVMILLGVSYLTINMHIQKVRKINPAETLRTE